LRRRSFYATPARRRLSAYPFICTYPGRAGKAWYIARHDLKVRHTEIEEEHMTFIGRKAGVAASLALMLAMTLALVFSGAARADTLSGAGLVEALRQGGYVVAMRHASSPRTPPVAGAAASDNVKLERELDEPGRAAARAMGEAMKTLRIPIGDVFSSPTYRALETIRLAQLPGAKPVEDLGDGGSPAMDTPGAPPQWLKAKAADRPRSGTNTIVVTHFPNMSRAFGDRAANLADGEALVFRPDGKGAAELVARVKIEDWPALAAAQK
jgi:phosphohistidine phosphatase SixA